MGDSLALGAGMGAATGLASTHIAFNATTGSGTSFDHLAVGAAIGASVGLLTSFITHKKIEETRKDTWQAETDIQFGDLPPSPFAFPKNSPRKGGR